MADGTQVPCEVNLDTREKIAHVFPGGKWHQAQFRENFTGRDNETANSFQWINGRYYPERYGKSWALTLLQSWTFTDDEGNPIATDQDGWYELSPDEQTVIAGAVAKWKDALILPTKTSDAPLIIKCAASEVQPTQTHSTQE